MKNIIYKFGLVALIVAPLATAFPITSNAESSGVVTFEAPYTVGNINEQQGWMKTGAYDVEVSNTSIPSFGTQSLRISDAITSGSFGDQTFAKPLVDAAGETGASTDGFPVGTLQPHFEMQFDIASVLPNLQPGMHVSVSPDRGDGSRMSYLRFEDQDNGIHVFFDDVTDPGLGTVATFNETDIATISRTPHTIKMTIDFVDGPSNDVVRVWIDGSLKITGKSWEDYYRYDPESAAEQNTRIVKTVLFRESGTPNQVDAGKGFFIDNLSLSSGPVPAQICSTVNLVSGTKTQTAGWTEINPTSVNALNPNVYSGSFVPATVTEPVVPPWVNPNANSNFQSSGALWVSTNATWPGGTHNSEGFPGNDQWRLFQDSFTLPAGASVSYANLSYTADNSAQFYMNSTPVASTNGEDVFLTPAPILPYNFAQVFSTPFTPVVGNNTLSFVVRNWGGDYSSNPTGLLYKATVSYCIQVPTTKDQCKSGGWQNLVHPDGSAFKNQGDCVSFVASGGKAKGNP